VFLQEWLEGHRVLIWTSGGRGRLVRKSACCNATNVTPVCLLRDTSVTPVCLLCDTNVRPARLSCDKRVTPVCLLCGIHVTPMCRPCDTNVMPPCLLCDTNVTLVWHCGTDQRLSSQDTSMEYPEYYLQPFHAYTEGNLCWQVWIDNNNKIKYKMRMTVNRIASHI
jgi:hypothetical protein